MKNGFKILEVAIRMDRLFTVQELAVEAWKAHPKDFGMRQYEYLDTTRIYPRIFGYEGLIHNQYLEVVGVNFLRVTEKAMILARTSGWLRDT